MSKSDVRRKRLKFMLSMIVLFFPLIFFVSLTLIVVVFSDIEDKTLYVTIIGLVASIMQIAVKDVYILQPNIMVSSSSKTLNLSTSGNSVHRVSLLHLINSGKGDARDVHVYMSNNAKARDDDKESVIYDYSSLIPAYPGPSGRGNLVDICSTHFMSEEGPSNTNVDFKSLFQNKNQYGHYPIYVRFKYRSSTLPVYRRGKVVIYYSEISKDQFKKINEKIIY